MSFASISPILPEEIWTKVFTYLPLEDRKRVRLTCRRFYEACNTFLIQKYELFVFRWNINAEVAIRSLSNIPRKLWNIKLKKVLLMDDSILTFFKKQGSHIYSLTFDECAIAPDIFSNVIEYCQTLHCLSLIYDGSEPTDTQERLFNGFIALQNNKIVCKSVTEFTFVLKITDFGYSCLLTNDKFLRFFAIFPNIRRLTLQFSVDDHFDQLSPISSNIISNEIFSFPCIYNQLLKMSHQLENLILHISHKIPARCCLSFQTWTKITRLIEMGNLKTVSLTENHHLWDAAIPVLPFKYLTHFICSINRETHRNDSPSDFILSLLNSAVRLRALSIYISNERLFYLSKECFKAIVKSHLDTLHIIHRHPVLKIDFDHLASDLVFLHPNRTLKYFSIQTCEYEFYLHDNLAYDRRRSSSHAPRRAHPLAPRPQHPLDPPTPPPPTTEETQSAFDNGVTYLFATHFRGLEHLKVQRVDTHIFTAILFNNKTLQDLELHHESISSYHKSEEFYSLKQWLTHNNYFDRPFNHLTHLSLLKSSSIELTKLLAQFKFPKLKSLIIRPGMSHSWKFREDGSSFYLTIHKFAELEYLEIENVCFIVTFKIVLALVEALPKLKYLFFSDWIRPIAFEDSECHQFFRACPSLRMFRHVINYPYSTYPVQFYKDISNTILRIIECDDSIMFEDVSSKYRISINKYFNF